MSKPVDDEQELLELLMTIRTTREVEHNDNQWTTEFVYSIEEAKARLLQWGTRQRIDELEGILLKYKTFVPEYNSEAEAVIEDRTESLQASLKDGGNDE